MARAEGHVRPKTPAPMIRIEGGVVRGRDERVDMSRKLVLQARNELSGGKPRKR